MAPLKSRAIPTQYYHFREIETPLSPGGNTKFNNQYSIDNNQLKGAYTKSFSISPELPALA